MLHNYGTLSRRSMNELLEQGSLFREGSWSPSNVRAACYDLRMARDVMVVPDRPASPHGKYYRKGKMRNRDVILRPGDVAFVSTIERLCIPWNVSGVVGAKFGLAAHGVLTLTGGFVDAGYGLRLDEKGEWIPKDDARLHFLLANLGPESVVLHPGDDAIATVQFTSIDEPEVKEDVASVGLQSVDETYLRDNEPSDVGLIFFRKVVDIDRRVAKTLRRVEKFEARLTGIEAGSNQVMMFGVYLVCLTLLGVALSGVLTIAQSDEIGTALRSAHSIILESWAVLVVGLLAVVGGAVVLWRCVRVVGRCVKRVANNAVLSSIDEKRGDSRS